jgi:hypothetical protein
MSYNVYRYEMSRQIVCFTITDNRDSSVGIATGYGLDCLGSVPFRGKVFLSSTTSRLILGPTQPPIQWIQWVLSTRAKRYGREADHLILSSANVKEWWNHTTTPQYIFMK